LVELGDCVVDTRIETLRKSRNRSESADRRLVGTFYDGHIQKVTLFLYALFCQLYQKRGQVGAVLPRRIDGRHTVILDKIPYGVHILAHTVFGRRIIAHHDTGRNTVFEQRLGVRAPYSVGAVQIAQVLRKPEVEIRLAARLLAYGNVVYVEPNGNGFLLPVISDFQTARILARLLIDGNAERNIKPLILACGNFVFSERHRRFNGQQRIGIHTDRRIVITG